jgi:hypothetical protein
MTKRKKALWKTAEAATNALLSLENVKRHLDDLTPEEARAWFAARQACDRLYRATNRFDIHDAV